MSATPVKQQASWIPDASTFGARLALVRQHMGWGNVATAAEACGQPAESWRTWERDNVTPRRIVEISREISEATGCDYIWLLTGGGMPQQRKGTFTELRPAPVRPTDTRPKGRPSGLRRPARIPRPVA